MYCGNWVLGHQRLVCVLKHTLITVDDEVNQSNSLIVLITLRYSIKFQGLGYMRLTTLYFKPRTIGVQLIQ